MSSFDIAIQLDDRDRTFAGGEPITGRVIVSADRETAGRQVTLEALWRAHGDGNTDEGGRQELTLAGAATFRPDSLAQFPFSITPRVPPVTYDGRHVNIDHYLRARADVPWAADARTERRVIVEPGPVAMHERKPVRQTRGGTSPPAFVYVVVAVGLVVLFMVAPPLAIIAAALGLVLGRNWIASRRIGAVNIHVAATRVCPGEPVPIEITCTPRKVVRLNKVTATVTARERARRRSGDKRKVREYKVVDHTVEVVGSRELQPGREAQFSGSVEVPEIGAFTFKSRHHEITWQLVVQIDIAGWPDWVSRYPLVVVPGVPSTDLLSAGKEEEEPGRRPVRSREIPPPPRPEARPRAPARPEAVRPVTRPAPPPLPTPPRPAPRPPASIPVPPPPPAAPAAPPVPAEPAAPAVPAQPAAPPAPAAPAEPAPPATGSPSDPDPAELLALLGEIGAASVFGSEREDLIARVKGRTFDFRLVFDRAQWTSGFDVPEAYRDGRTVLGHIGDTQTRAKLLFPSVHNRAIDALQSGAPLAVTATLIEWDTLHDCGEFEVTEQR